MKYKIPGRSGLRVSELCLGTMTFGTLILGDKADALDPHRADTA